MLKIIFLSAFALTTAGCSSLDNSFKSVDCTAIYTVKTFPDIGKTAMVKVDAIRVDRFGEIYVRPKNSLLIHFSPGFKPKNILTNYKCNGESYGL